MTRGWSAAAHSRLVCALTELFKEVSSANLATVITHSRLGEDGHIDHRNLHRAVVAAYEEAFTCAPRSANALPLENLASASTSNFTTGGPELRWKTCGRRQREGKTVQGLPRLGASAKRRTPVPTLKVFWPVLDYGEIGNRLKPATVPRTCNETSKRTRLVESYLRDKGFAPSVLRNVCHETRELWSQGGAPTVALRVGTKFKLPTFVGRVEE